MQRIVQHSRLLGRRIALTFAHTVARLVAVTGGVVAAEVGGEEAFAKDTLANGRPYVRVVTYNIHHAEGTDGRVDVDRVANVIRSLSPDVVCLQEVDRNLPRTRHSDMPALLADKLGMAVAFDANYRFDGGEYGNATLTRYPVAETRNHALPQWKAAEPRGCLEVVVQVEGRKVHLFNTHWGLHAEERAQQAGALLKLLPKDAPAILMGDLNEAPSAPAVGQVLGRMTDAMAAKGVASKSYPTAHPSVRIDYILASPAFSVETADTAKAPGTDVASDHLPCMADLRFRQG